MIEPFKSTPSTPSAIGLQVPDFTVPATGGDFTLSAHLGKPPGPACEGNVDGHAVPIPHFGAILPPEEFWRFAERLRQAGIRFLMEPTLRFAGKPGEQATMFFLDPDGNALEFKAFTRADEVFARQA